MIPTIRAAVPRDLDAVARIHVDCWNEIYNFMPDDVMKSRDHANRLAQWTKFLAEPRAEAILFVVVLDDEVVGFAHMEDCNDPDIPDAKGLFNAVYFKKEVRRLGLGVYLLDRMIKFALDHNQWPAGLWAFRDNPGRHRTEDAGWKPVAYRDRIIDGHAIPEVGYLAPADPIELYHQMNRHFAEANVDLRMTPPPIVTRYSSAILDRPA